MDESQKLYVKLNSKGHALDVSNISHTRKCKTIGQKSDQGPGVAGRGDRHKAAYENFFA